MQRVDFHFTTRSNAQFLVFWILAMLTGMWALLARYEAEYRITFSGLGLFTGAVALALLIGLLRPQGCGGYFDQNGLFWWTTMHRPRVSRFVSSDDLKAVHLCRSLDNWTMRIVTNDKEIVIPSYIDQPTLRRLFDFARFNFPETLTSIDE